jgi:hypothetical protein
MLGASRSSGGGGAVASVHGRTGAVVANTGDYAASQIVGLGGASGVFVVTPGLTQTLTAPSTISATSGAIPITSTSAITLTSNPQISSGSNGQKVALCNTGTFAITLVAGNGLLMPQNYILYGGKSVSFTYFSAFSSWIIDGIIPESVALTGAPTTPAPAWNTNSLQIAPTKFVYDHLYNHDLPGWRTLTMVAANWGDFSVGTFGALQIKRVGRDLIYLRGVVSMGTTFNALIATLPTDCRPSVTQNFVGATSSGFAQMSIAPSGAFTTSGTFTTGQFQVVSISYTL